MTGAMPTSSIVFVVISSLVGSFGAVFLKLGAERMQGGLARLLSNYWLFAGIVFYLLSSVFYILAVSQPGALLTVLYPMVSIGYIWAMIWARIFFKEPFTTAKVGGLVLIVAGVALLNFGSA
jgi:multidrug transporter EmrE-like cation transporter